MSDKVHMDDAVVGIDRDHSVGDALSAAHGRDIFLSTSRDNLEQM